MKHIIITGGAGFIGSHLTENFLSKGYRVTVVDNLLTGRLENLRSFEKNPHFYFLNHDVCQRLDREKIPFLKTSGLAGVLHFACPASPVDFDRIPFEILEVDSLGTIETVKLALDYQCRYLVASTSEVYGDPLVHPQKESYFGNVNPNGPRACYDETKRFAEAYVSTATRLKGLKGGIVRIFNTYGPRMRIDDGRVVPELCRLALKGLPLTIHGSGKQTRSFCYVSDLVDGIVLLFESEEKGPINIGNPEEKTILEFASLVISHSKGKSTLIHSASREDDPKQRCPDIALAKDRLGWVPRVSIDEGLRKTLAYFQSEL